MNRKTRSNSNTEVKQAFLSSAISDISSNIHLIDTKVSIVMAAMVALIAAVAPCHETIYTIWKKIDENSCIRCFLIILAVAFLLSFIATFIFAILTLRGHSSKIEYKSKWYIKESINDYSLVKYKREVTKMTDEDILENMAAELYKLNDINRQKFKTNKWTIYSFSSTLIIGGLICILLLLSFIQK